MNKRHMGLTEGPIVKSIALFAFPLLLSNMFQQLYNSVDSAVVGSFSSSANLAAVGSTAALINLLIGFFLGISTGTGVLYAMRYGARDYDGLKKLTDAAFFLSVSAGVFISAVGIVFAPQMLAMMDTPEDVLPISVVYLRIYLSGTIFNMIYNVGAAMVQAQGNSMKPLMFLFASGVLNLIMDVVFVASFRMGAEGAAIATVMAQALSAVLVLRSLICQKTEYRFRPLKMRIDKTALRELIRISIPCGLQGSMFNISNLLVQAKINSFGSIAMAGVAAYSKIDGFIYMPTMALSLSVSTYVGQNIGAGHFERVKKGVLACLVMAVLISGLVGCAAIFGFKYVIGLFTKDPEAVAFARSMMWYMAPFVSIFVFSDILGGAIRGAGKPMPVTIISALCICVFRIVWLEVLLHISNDIRFVYACYPVSWFLSSAAMTVYYFHCPAIQKLGKPAGAAAG